MHHVHPEEVRLLLEVLETDLDERPDGGTGIAGGAEPIGGLADQLIELMQAAQLPIGLSEIGYRESDIPILCAGAQAQTRLLRNAPRLVDAAALQSVFSDAMRYRTAHS